MFSKLFGRLVPKSKASNPSGQDVSYNSAEYRYEPLATPTTTRVCILHPGSNDGPIRCTLFPIDLDTDHKSYVALSYTWNDGIKTNYILCDNFKISVTSSLHSALQRLRKLGYKQLWIDALSINQSTDRDALSERAEQVRLMHRIFSQADKVIVDLGDYDRHTTKALLFAQKMYQALESFKNNPEVPTGANGMKTLAFPTDLYRYLESWKIFMARRWFRRVWVIQEYSLAKTVEMVVGTEHIRSDAITNTASIIWMTNKHLLYAQGLGDPEQERVSTFALESIDNLSMMLTMRAKLLGNDRQTFAELVGLTRQFESTDARDKVYGLLGMASDGHQIEVDYNESVSRVYYRAACHMIQSGFVFLMLSHAGGSTQLENLPSWVPDFSTLKVISNIALEIGNPIYSAASSRPADVQQVGDVLRVSGFFFDEIKDVSVPYEDDDINSMSGYYDDPDVLLKPHLRPLKWLQKVIQFATDNESGIDLTDSAPPSLWRTLIAAWFEGSRDLSEASGYPKAVEDFRAANKLNPFYLSAEDIPTSFLKRVAFEKKRKADADQAITQGYLSYSSAMFDKITHKRVCRTSKDVLGLVPKWAQPGDMVVLMLGSGLPHIMRKREEAGKFKYIGNCYIDGIMDGEALEDMPNIISIDLS